MTRNLSKVCSNAKSRSPHAQMCQILRKCVSKCFFEILIRVSKKFLSHSSVGIYLLKFNNRNTRARCETCSKLAIKTPEQCRWRHITPCSSVSTVNFEHCNCRLGRKIKTFRGLLLVAIWGKQYYVSYLFKFLDFSFFIFIFFILKFEKNLFIFVYQ